MTLTSALCTPAKAPKVARRRSSQEKASAALGAALKSRSCKRSPHPVSPPVMAVRAATRASAMAQAARTPAAIKARAQVPTTS